MKKTPEETYRARKQFFNDHAGSWLDTWYRDPGTGLLDRHRKDFERLFAIVPLKPGDRVLDAGCGSGILVPMILQRITRTGTLYELDFAEKMIETNRELHGEGNIRFLVADAADAPLEDESIDVVFCFSCFPHFHDKDRTMQTLSRILVRGGTLVVSHFESSEGINKHHASCQAVMHDHLAGEPEMRGLFRRNALHIDRFIDEPGFYCIRATKRAFTGGPDPHGYSGKPPDAPPAGSKSPSMAENTGTAGSKHVPAAAAVCGLPCDACSIFIGSHEDPARLAALAARMGWNPEEAHCDGCRSAKRTPYCRACGLYRCAERRGYAFCSECGEYPCADLEAFHRERPHRAEIRENLQRIGEIGADSWLAEIRRRYACPSCGTLNSAYDLKCRACGHEPGCDYVEAHREEILKALSAR